MRRFKEIFPVGTAAELSLRTGAKFSHCEKVVQGKRALGGDFLIALLQSDVGNHMLIAMMGEARPAWWTGFRRHLDLVALVKQQSETQRAIEQMQREFAQ